MRDPCVPTEWQGSLPSKDRVAFAAETNRARLRIVQCGETQNATNTYVAVHSHHVMLPWASVELLSVRNRMPCSPILLVLTYERQ